LLKRQISSNRSPQTALIELSALVISGLAASDGLSAAKPIMGSFAQLNPSCSIATNTQERRVDGNEIGQAGSLVTRNLGTKAQTAAMLVTSMPMTCSLSRRCDHFIGSGACGASGAVARPFHFDSRYLPRTVDIDRAAPASHWHIACVGYRQRVV
jgi:hypothetical protein